ncbi:MAG: flagellar hook-basal body complex protein, partial [Cyanobacteria bacterium]|nr:flagellar hook-basal body complex protein [Cyanobacteriota bacterium]
MTQGMFAAVSGVRANLTRLNVISNNIANLNTIGFKSSSVNFGTVFSQTLFGGTRPTSALGGVNPRQVGVGTQVVDITTNFSQGGAQFTGRNSDLYINGNGFFVIQKADPSSTQASGFVLTRAGNFNLDSSGNLITAPDGFKLQGTSQLVGTSPLTITQVNIPPELTVVKHLNASGQIVGTNIGIVPSNSALLTAPIATAAGQIGASSVTQNRQVVKLQSFTVGSDGAINATYSNGDRITVRTNATTLATATAAGDLTLTRREIVHLPAEGGNFPMMDFQTGDNNFGTVGAPPAAGVAAAGLSS